MTKQKHSNISSALHNALEQYQELVGHDFPVVPKLTVHKSKDFWALTEMVDGDLTISVGGGFLPTLTSLWDDAFCDHDFLSGVGTPFVANKFDAINVSLVWLVLHELQHYDLGHFDIIGRGFISETERGKSFALVSHSPSQSPLLEGLSEADQSKVEPCLELQADHEAIELVLDAYSTDEWPSLRARIASISSMMMLIEREDAKMSMEHSSHPKAATRIFQLLGHVTEMPLIPAQRKAIMSGADAINPVDLPSDDEQSAFNRQVVIPAFFDAVNLARIAGSDSIRSDLGDAEHFFRDVQIAKSNDPSMFNDLKTIGAKQWAELVLVNEQIMQLRSES